MELFPVEYGDTRGKRVETWKDNEEHEAPQDRFIGGLVGGGGSGADTAADDFRGLEYSRLPSGLVLGRLSAKLPPARPAEGSPSWMPNRRRHPSQRDHLRQLRRGSAVLQTGLVRERRRTRKLQEPSTFRLAGNTGSAA